MLLIIPYINLKKKLVKINNKEILKIINKINIIVE